MKVLYFGGYNDKYPRNSVIRKGLSTCGWSITECRVSHNAHPIKKHLDLLLQFTRLPNKQFDVMILAERGQEIVLLAWILSRLIHVPLVIDFLYSRFDTQMEKDAISAKSLRGYILWFFDWLALRLGDLLLCDTRAQLEFYVEAFGLIRNKAQVLYHGVDTAIYHPVEMQPDSEQRVVFWGSYTPSHGVDTIVQVANSTQRAS